MTNHKRNFVVALVMFVIGCGWLSVTGLGLFYWLVVMPVGVLFVLAPLMAIGEGLLSVNRTVRHPRVLGK